MVDRDLYDEIARVAYDLWEKNGCIHGRDIEHWCEAERIVISRIQPVEEEKPKKARSARKTPAKSGKTAGTTSRTRKTTGAKKS